MTKDSRRALLLQIIAEARAVERHAATVLLSDDREEPRRLSAWLYRLACEVAMLRGWPRPRIDHRIESAALDAHAAQAWQWRAFEVAKKTARWFLRK